MQYTEFIDKIDKYCKIINNTIETDYIFNLITDDTHFNVDFRIQKARKQVFIRLSCHRLAKVSYKRYYNKLMKYLKILLAEEQINKISSN